jgi:hypothetical protein
MLMRKLSSIRFLIIVFLGSVLIGCSSNGLLVSDLYTGENPTGTLSKESSLRWLEEHLLVIHESEPQIDIFIIASKSGPKRDVDFTFDFRYQGEVWMDYENMDLIIDGEKFEIGRTYRNNIDGQDYGLSYKIEDRNFVISDYYRDAIKNCNALVFSVDDRDLYPVNDDVLIKLKEFSVDSSPGPKLVILRTPPKDLIGLIATGLINTPDFNNLSLSLSFARRGNSLKQVSLPGLDPGSVSAR